ncbi:MAG: hypothetical protein GX575_11980 [Candidatus Anammoximicrobium sp.]|nr:hypothetical protein [Candidatus Anammoximicrobium sp.]
MTPSEEDNNQPVTPPASEFAEQAQQSQPGILAEFWDFFIHNKKWWLTPIIVVLLLMGLLILLSGTAAAPFIYTIW